MRFSCRLFDGRRRFSTVAGVNNRLGTRPQARVVIPTQIPTHEVRPDGGISRLPQTEHSKHP